MSKSIIYPEIYHRLVDKESQIYYVARQNYISDSKISSFYRQIRNLHIEYKFRDIENYLIAHSSNGWIIWGHDDTAYYHYLLLQDSPHRLVGMTDYGCSAKAADVPFISIERSIRLVNEEGYTLLLPKHRYSERIKSLFLPENVLAVDDHLVGRCGWQYFDFFKPNEDEVFVDGGSLDGNTSIEFTKWCDGKYRRIYAFEPNPNMIFECMETLNTIPDHGCYLYNCALWNRKCKLYFNNDNFSKWDACVSNDGGILVNADTLDNIIDQEKVTFIKLDVEGSELETLEGAAEIIKRDHPRMAISVYHKKNDLFDIAHYLMSLWGDYSFAIRHYHSDTIETILYVF